MEALLISQTDDSPEIILDPHLKIFKISGESRPENPALFYGKVLSWLKEYGKVLYWVRDNSDTVPGFDLEFEMDYFNSSSAKFLMDIILYVKELNNSGYTTKVVWICDSLDEDMMEAGCEFEQLIDFKFVHKTK